ncbi:MAG: ComEC/Rec2 family competence protein [Planctomycetota bacterium]
MMKREITNAPKLSGRSLSRCWRGCDFAKQWFLILLTCLLLVASVAYADKEQPSDLTPSINTPITPTAVSGIPLKVHYIDVGQADCILIQIPNGKNVLIDAGNSCDADKIVSYLQHQKVKKLDNVIATHPHADHMGAMDTIINKFDVGKFIMPNATSISNTFSKVVTTNIAYIEKHLEITYAHPGLLIDLSPNITAQVIAPISPTYQGKDKENNYSIVIHLEFGKTSFLFMGDALEESENEILKSGFDIKSDVLKVGHHGSKTSTGTSFLRKVHPSYAVIPVGKNNIYGHPKQITLKRLEDDRVQVFRTDESGTILIESDGKDLKVTTERKPESIQTGSKKADENPEEVKIYVTRTGTKYHRADCEYLAKSMIPISLKEAKKREYEPCKVCNPPK